ncbi:OmpA family protein [Myxococcota bacterium]|nr:OmpA family protein [Myxococcota bacterium]HOD07223.1 OmpA family protein [Myxococcota bacterium]
MMRYSALAGVVMIAVMLGGCGVKKEVYLRDTAALRDQISGLERQKSDLVGQRDKLNGELERVRQEKSLLLQEKNALAQKQGTLSTELREALEKQQKLEQQARERQAKLEQLRNLLKDLSAQGKLNVRVDKGRMIVEIGEAFLFDSGQYKLKPEGKASLAELTALLAGIEGRSFQVAGHTDSVGSEDKNWRLSANRALEVVLFMIESGMPPDRISVAGYGENQPVGDNEVPEGRAMNRRIEIVLQPNLDEILGFTGE